MGIFDEIKDFITYIILLCGVILCFFWLCGVIITNEQCKQPYKQVCGKSDCHTVFQYNIVFKRMMPQVICKCTEYKMIENKCYKGE